MSAHCRKCTVACHNGLASRSCAQELEYPQACDTKPSCREVCASSQAWWKLVELRSEHSPYTNYQERVKDLGVVTLGAHFSSHMQQSRTERCGTCDVHPKSCMPMTETAESAISYKTRNTSWAKTQANNSLVQVNGRDHERYKCRIRTRVTSSRARTETAFTKQVGCMAKAETTRGTSASCGHK